MEVLLKKFAAKSIVPFKKYDTDFCYDCVAITCQEIAPNVFNYDLGIGTKINKKDFIDQIATFFCKESTNSKDEIIKWLTENIRLSVDIRPRSSIWETGMILCNCEGTIDEGYTNVISAKFYRVVPNMPIYKVGDKVCQLKIGITFNIDFKEIDNLKVEEGDRGLNGWGSTNKSNI